MFRTKFAVVIDREQEHYCLPKKEDVSAVAVGTRRLKAALT
jgi:hypothetical protein